MQFTLSLIFIISVLVLSNQLEAFINADYGFDISQKINVRLNQTNYETLQAELSQQRNITNTSAVSAHTGGGYYDRKWFQENIGDTNSTMLYYFFVDDQYLENFGISLIAGRNFDPAAGASNKGFMLTNEQAVKDLF